MTIVVAASFGRVDVGDVVRIEREGERFVAYKNGYCEAGMVLALAPNSADGAERLLSLGDMAYCRISKRIDGLLYGEVIIPPDIIAERIRCVGMQSEAN